MITYIATFYSHYGAIQFRRNCQAMNLSAEGMPVPRDLSSSCGTCVRFHTEADFPEKTEEVEQIVRVEMDAKGAEEIYTQSVQPAELWKESGRWDANGPVMTRHKDRTAREY